MRFRRLELIRYGKFTDAPIDFPPNKRDFHLLVGANEAGKSTVRSAILDLLFGIPTRSTLDFIHPKSELRIGATIENGTGTLDFHRAKANRQSLRSPSDAPLADDVLAPYLGNADWPFFDKMFGLDHMRLVEGGNSILSAADDVGQVLFQSAAGVASLGKVRDALEQEAMSLWAPRKSSERLYYLANEQLERATAALKQATVRTKDWVEAHSNVEALTEALESERIRHRALTQQRNRLERVRRTAPFVQALRDSERRLNELGTVNELPANAASVLDEAERALATAEQLQTLRLGEVSTIERVLADIRVDEAVLRSADDIKALDAMRIQYRTHERDIEHRASEVATLWQEVADACAQLGWPSDTEDLVRSRLPTLIVRREIGQLARKWSGLTEAVKAAEQAERAKELEIDSTQELLAGLPDTVVQPQLRAALENARSLGHPDSAFQKADAAASKAKGTLDAALLALTPWSKQPAELRGMDLPSQTALSRLVQERQTLAAEQRAALSRKAAQESLVESKRLEVKQYAELHRPPTQQEVLTARDERNTSWTAIKRGDVGLTEGAEHFEFTMTRADSVADVRLDKVEEATQLQSLLHEVERQEQQLTSIEQECQSLSDKLQELDRRWSERMAVAGLTGMELEGLQAWLVKRDKTLAADDAHIDALSEQALIATALAEYRAKLSQALTLTGLVADERDSLSALCVQAEQFVKDSDAAQTRRETLSEQMAAAQSVLASLVQATAIAKSALTQWEQTWSDSLIRAGLPEHTEVTTAEAALELISGIEEKLKKMRQIRAERIDTMKADLEGFATESLKVSRDIAPDLVGQPAVEIALQLVERLNAASGANAERERLQQAHVSALSQVNAASEAITTTEATLRPLMERAQVDSLNALQHAIARSDEYRALVASRSQATAKVLEGGDGLPIEQLCAELDAADLPQLIGALMSLESELSEAVNRQTALSAELESARQGLARIGGTGEAAHAEAQRQEAIAQMADAAERYVKVATAGRLLRWAIDRYREDKQGPMLSRASMFFSTLTLGSFKKLVVDFESEPMTLEGQRSDGTLVGIAGMSDGTRDQLYFALRLAALELHLERASPLPFIADDLFINYDDARAEAGFEALAALSERTQIIFLTHHDHLVPAARRVFGGEINVVTLSDESLCTTPH